jgi:hypothetical protein
MVQSYLTLLLAFILSILLLAGCSGNSRRQQLPVSSAGTGALIDGEATNSVGDGDVVTESGMNSQIGEPVIEEERRYEYRSGR